ncbi:hemolytic protein HlpA [soil metagenome]
MNLNANGQFTTPLLFLIFCRPDTTKLVFEAIRKVRPTKLYIAADGPREGRQHDVAKCEATRKIATDVDWPCEVHTLFREKNLGLGEGITTGISWFFNHETEGVILEDDCLPSPSFFPFCEAMLERYRYDTRIMEIGGNNMEGPGMRDEEYSYSFSNQMYIWGWATWRRAWQFHDFKMDHYPEINRKKYLDYSYDSIYERDFSKYVFSKMHEGDDQTNRKTIWDYQWQFASKINSGLAIVPGRNLIKNLGFGSEATNTHNPNGAGSNLVLEEMNFPLRHPGFVMADRGRDNRVFRECSTSFSSRWRSRAKELLPKRVVEKVLKPLMNLYPR